MSFQGAVHHKLTAAGLAALSLIALSLSFESQVYAQDSDSSLIQKPETVDGVGPSEPIPNPTPNAAANENGIKAEPKSVQKPNSKPVKTPVDRRASRNAVAEKLKLAKRGNYPSRGYFSGRRIIDMHATAYTADPAENGGNTSGRTANGLKIGHGIVAVDPRVIPLGTRLFIEGYGHAVAADTGGAIKGHRIDLGCDNKRQMRKIGRRRVTVHILD